MSSRTAISGTYSDLKFIRSRKVAQVVIEIPIEEAGVFTSLFGTPNPATETWVAMARLVDGGARVGREEAEPAVRRKFSELLPAQQSGIRCNEPAFWRFLSEYWGYQVKNADDAAEAVRDACKVQSRADLNMIGGDGGKRWRVLNAEFDVWMMPQ